MTKTFLHPKQGLRLIGLFETANQTVPARMLLNVISAKGGTYRGYYVRLRFSDGSHLEHVDRALTLIWNTRKLYLTSSSCLPARARAG